MTNTSSSEPRQRIREGRRGYTVSRLLNGLSLGAAMAAMLLILAGGLRGPGPSAAAVAPTLTGAPLSTAPPPTATPELPTPAPTEAAGPSATPTASASPEASATSEPSATPTKPLIAIVAGHRNNDSGAICDGGPYDGLHEVHVTTAVTAALVSLLTARGYEVIDLDEFDPQMYGLVADALISLHVDSCVEWVGTSGFKVARASNSAIPAVEDRLVACLESEYARATKLEVHPYTITHNMRNYHAFRQVDPSTPAAIVELGFLFHDHDLLVDRQEVVVEGLRRAIDCFMEGE